MREQWARGIALLTGQLVLLLAVVFAVSQNLVETPETSKPVTPMEVLEPIALDPQRIEAGRRVYQQQTCARCHAIAGKGNPRNPLDGVGARRSAKDLRDWIIGAETLQEVLPARAFTLKQAYRELSNDDLDALVVYMQSLRPESNRTAQTEPAVTPASVPAGEDGKCLTCHSNAGHLMQVVKPRRPRRRMVVPRRHPAPPSSMPSSTLNSPARCMERSVAPAVMVAMPRLRKRQPPMPE